MELDRQIPLLTQKLETGSLLTLRRVMDMRMCKAHLLTESIFRLILQNTIRVYSRHSPDRLWM